MHSNVFAEISGSATTFRAPSSIARAGAFDPVSIGRVIVQSSVLNYGRHADLRQRPRLRLRAGAVRPALLCGRLRPAGHRAIAQKTVGYINKEAM